MKILISALRFVKNRTYGGEVYFESFLKALNKVKYNNDQIFIASSPETCKWIKKIAPGMDLISVEAPNSNLKAFYHECIQAPIIAKDIDADVAILPFNLMPKMKIPSILMVHDLVNRFYLNNFPTYRPIYNWLLWKLVKRSIISADAIITPSEAIADEIMSLRLKDKENVFPVSEAAEKKMRGVEEGSDSCIDEQFILLQTGAKLPHKSQETGLKALAKLKNISPDLYERGKLIITGGNRNERRSLVKLSVRLGINNKVTFTGKLGQNEFEKIVREATLILFPTLYEGFGLGIVEAQMEGKAVVASNIPVLQEVSGGAAAFFEPGNEVSLASVIEKLLTDEYLRLKLEKKGLNNAIKWTWEDHARGVLDVLSKVLSQ